MDDSRVENIFGAYFDSNIALLKISALWIDPPHSERRKWHILLNLVAAFFLYLVYFPSEVAYLYYVYNDLDQFVRGLRDIGNHVASIYKTFNYFRMRREILKLLDILQENKFDYESHGDFQPKLIVEQFKNEAVKWTNMFWYFVNGICATMFLSGLIVLVFNSGGQYVVESGEKVYRQKLPVYVISPFGMRTKNQFFMTFIYVIFFLTFYAWMIIALDSLFTTIMSCLSAHLTILGGAFETLRPRCLKRLQIYESDILHDPETLQDETNKEMTKCVRHLQTLYRVAEKLEYIYNFQTFFQTMISLGEMCFCLYLLSKTIDENTGNEITYLISTSFQLLMYCWFGNKVTETSIALKYSLFKSDWFSVNSAYKRKLILTMTRLNRPIHVTIGKITPLTFTTFLTIARSAYSFFTFLKQRDGLMRK